MSKIKLPLSFYQRATKKVALELLGKRLVRIYKGERISGLITEVEAYLGVKDKACHTYGHRRTPRTEVMYKAGGYSYIYFIYGMYNCFNVVTEKQDCPEAVLIRALQPVEGIDLMKSLRQTDKLSNLTTGPGKLAEALHLNKELNGVALNSKNLFIEDAPTIPSAKIAKKARIGISYADDHAEWPLRFYIKNNPYISKK